MRDANVGFQCPECVSRGAKETRSGRATYGGARSGDPRITSMVLIVLNALVWLAIQATGGSSSWLISKLALMPVGKCMVEDGGGSFYPMVSSAAGCAGPDVDVFWAPGVADGAPWQMITSAFTHVDLMHIGFNMLALWFLGPALEAAVGRTRFLAIYLGSALIGSVAVVLLADPLSTTVGASGAVFGMLAAHLVVGRKVGADISQLLLWIGLNVVITLGVESISWQGHLGGFVGGALITAGIVYSPKGPRRAVLQWSALGLVLLLGAAITVLRSTALQ